MSKWNKGLMATMEEFEEVQQTAATGMSDKFENVLEIQESARSISQFSDSMSEAVQGAHDLHQMSELISTECDCEAAMEIAHISVESIYKRLGISQRILPSLENYRDKVALEFIGKAVSSVWNAIKAAFIKLYEMIKGFFKWLFGFSDSADKKIASAKEETAKISTNKPTVEITIEPAGANTSEKTATNTEEHSIVADVKSGELDAVIQATVQQTVLHDPNHAADPAAQQQIRETVEEVTDKIKNGVVVTTPENVDSVIDSSTKPVVCGNKVYVPINQMNAGHYIKYIQNGKTDPSKVKEGLEQLISLLDKSKRIDELLLNLSYVEVKDSEEQINEAVSKIINTASIQDMYDTSIPGYFKVEKNTIDLPYKSDARDNYLIVIPELKEGKPGEVELHEKIGIPSKKEMQEIEELLDELNKKIKAVQAAKKDIDTVFKEVHDNLTKLQDNGEALYNLNVMMNLVQKLMAFRFVSVTAHCATCVKQYTDYTKQAKKLYRNKNKMK